MFSQLLRSKTLLFALILAVLSVLQVSMGVFTPYLSPQTMGIVTLVISLVVAILRVVTTLPLSAK